MPNQQLGAVWNAIYETCLRCAYYLATSTRFLFSNNLTELLLYGEDESCGESCFSLILLGGDMKMFIKRVAGCNTHTHTHFIISHADDIMESINGEISSVGVADVFFCVWLSAWRVPAGSAVWADGAGHSAAVLPLYHVPFERPRGPRVDTWEDVTMTGVHVVFKSSRKKIYCTCCLFAS